MNKKLGSGLVVVILVIAGLIWQLAPKPEKTVISILENAASDTLDTRVTTSDFFADMEQGKASIGGLSIANLKGYFREHIIVIESIEADLDTTAMQDQLMVIDTLRINNPRISYESNKPGVSNIHGLLENIESSSAENKTRFDKDGLRVIIKKLVISGGEIAANAIETPGKITKVVMPPVEIFNIGQAGGGLSTEETVSVVAGELVNTVLRTAANVRLDIAIKPVKRKWVDAVRKELEPDG